MRKPESEQSKQSDRRQTEESLLLFKEAVDNSSNAVGMSTPEGKHYYQNKAFDELFGPVGENPPESVYVDPAIGHEVFRTVMAGGQWTGEVQMYARDRKVLTILLHAYASKDQAGHITRLIGIHTDITGRKAIEETLRSSEQEKALILDGIEDVIAYHDKNMCLIWANQAYLNGIQTITGTPARMEDVRGRHCCDAWKLPKPCIGCPVRIAIETGKTNEAELTPENQPHWPATQGSWHVKASPVRDSQGHVIGAIEISSNITERKKWEQERRELDARLQQTQRIESLGVLAGGIAHDFNNILMGIMGHADLALDELSPLSPGRKSISEIVTASKRAAELCGQMLAYAGRGRVERRNVALADLVEETLHMLKTSISKKTMLNWNLEKSLPFMHGDPSQIGQILMNLVINASDAIGDRSGVITISTGAMDCSAQYLANGYIVAPGKPGTYVYIEVSDTGCGMDKQTVQRIFEPFYTTKFTGRGLGLSAVMGIVKAHEGALRVYSEPGKGSTFKVLFPAIEVAGERELEGDVSGAWHGSGTVLLVDDEESIRAISSKQLQRLGLGVLTAEDGRQAVDLYRSRRPEIALVLLDLTMPHMNGEEAYRELRQIDPEVRVILASGYSENDIAARFAGKGLAGCLQKPYTLAKLRSLLSTLLPKAEPTTRSEEGKCPIGIGSPLAGTPSHTTDRTDRVISGSAFAPDATADTSAVKDAE